MVAFVRRLVGRNVKVGHLGTLDPGAAGVLPVAVGMATKTIDYMPAVRKQYVAELVLGLETTTLDGEGDIVGRCSWCATRAGKALDSSGAEVTACGEGGWPGCPLSTLRTAAELVSDWSDCDEALPKGIGLDEPCLREGGEPSSAGLGSHALAWPCLPTRARLEEVCAQFSGEIIQVPPAVSALHIEGRRGYELVREGEAVNMPGRPAYYYEVRVLSVRGRRVRLLVECGPGTYIRALVRDIGIALGCGATMVFLLRTASGAFVIDEAASIDELRGEAWKNVLRPMSDILPRCGFATVHIPEPDLAHFFRGHYYECSASGAEATPLNTTTLNIELGEPGPVVLLFAQESHEFLGLGRLLDTAQPYMRVERVLLERN